VGLAKWVQKIPSLILAGIKFPNPVLLCAMALEHFPTFPYTHRCSLLFIYFFLSFFFVQNVDLLQKFGIFFLTNSMSSFEKNCQIWKEISLK
jgi:hypothetical protein